MENKEAEQSVLGAILLDGKTILKVSSWLSPKHFSDNLHGTIYESLVSISERGENIDLVTVSSDLENKGKLKKIGGRTYLTDLVSIVPTSQHLVEYANLVKDSFIKRELNLSGSRIVKMSESDMSTKDIIKESEKLIFGAANDGISSFNLFDRDIVKEYEEYEEEYRELASTGLMGLSTGIELLDNMTYGMMPGNIWVCGAYYGYGKTYLAINIINKALEDGKRVLFFSLEMPATAVIQRIIGLRAGLNSPEVVGKLPDYKKKNRDREKNFVLKCISDGMLIIDDQLRNTDSILGRLMMLEKTNHIDLTVVDYVQLLADGRDQYEALREATKNIQSVTKQTKTTTLLLSQVNNQAQRDGANSMVDGFKGAGDIGQIADVALKIERERNVNTGQFSDSFILRVTKVRHNQPGNIKCKISFPGGKIAQDNSIALVDTEEEFDNFLGGR